MSRATAHRLYRQRRLFFGLVLTLVLLSLAGGAWWYRQQLQDKNNAALRESANAKKRQLELDQADSADILGRLGVLADAHRVHIRQSTVEINDALERLKQSEGAPLRLTYRIDEPEPREQPVAGLQLADRRISIELGTVTEAPILDFLMGLPDSLNGAQHIERLEIERKLPVDDDLLARLSLGERPDVLLTQVQLRVGSIVGPAPTPSAPVRAAATNGKAPQ